MYYAIRNGQIENITDSLKDFILTLKESYVIINNERFYKNINFQNQEIKIIKSHNDIDILELDLETYFVTGDVVFRNNGISYRLNKKNFGW